MTIDAALCGLAMVVGSWIGCSGQAAGGPAQGMLSGKQHLASRIYDGMESDYWVYVPAGLDASTPAAKKPLALMVFQDGEGYLRAGSDHAAIPVLDHLIAAGKIPPMVAVFVNPGTIDDAPGTATYNFVGGYAKKWSRTLKDAMRSTEYDTVSDRYARFLREELLPEVEKIHALRQDAYSRAITGSSSGGICAFNAGWQEPEHWSRVISWIGSFTAIQWHEDPAVADGGQDYPEKILREAHRNIRVWIEDGNGDQENDRYGSWPLANVRIANALKLKGYDFRFSFGTDAHNQKQGGAEFAQEMTWLWRGYDAAKTSETFVQDAGEAKLPVFRVKVVNREVGP